MEYKAYKFRLYPTKEQQSFFEKTFGCTRFVYNYFLHRKVKSFKEQLGSLTYTKCAKELAEMKQKEEYSFLREVDSIALQQALRHLEKAFNNYYQKQDCGFPKFKSKHHSKQNYTTIRVNNNMSLKEGVLRLPKIGKIRIKQHREVPDDCLLKKATISKTKTGKYYVSLVYLHEKQVQEIPLNTFLGLDFTMSGLYIDSNGEKPTIPHCYEKTMEQLKKEQKKLSLMKKGSNNWIKQKKRIAKKYEKLANQRLDYLHKQSRLLAENADCICVESLKLQEMAKGPYHFGKQISKAGWATFVSFLQYKLEDQGKKLVKIDQYYPSSQICNICGAKNSELKDFSIREWSCPSCGKLLLRDLNAAINIREEGKRIAMG